MKRQYVTTLAFLTVFSSRGSGKSINTQKYENIIPLKAPAGTLAHLMVLILLFYFFSFSTFVPRFFIGYFFLSLPFLSFLSWSLAPFICSWLTFIATAL